MNDKPVPSPNYTQIPNCVLEALPRMSEAAMRVCLVICRQTFGYHKKRDQISLSQLEELTGMARTSVQRGLTELITRGWVERLPAGRQTYTYALIVAEIDRAVEDQNTSSAKLPVAQSYQSSKATSSGSFALPELVAQSYTQKKELKKKEKEREARATRDATPAPKVKRDTSSNGTRLTMTDLPDEWRAFCLESRPDLDPDKLWPVFRDHWDAQPGQKGRKADWFATWRNWVRREDKPQFKRGSTPHNGRLPRAIQDKIITLKREGRLEEARQLERSVA